ncbi:Undecaprenyl phosphate-alpha-4-amino-4-deoxy-L-arabinose arabinosyl transferase [Aminobacter sp. MSH1]|uniref:ArnT family glycosyltransferase n=1 Tax=Aminobacter sp. MSH1 TaxID=374606 RepID=UPI000D366C1D|nr:glycosyltransferase family 39 protein [Aminobacter sp. MSH1]AWC23275.1 Undecaprenyl phosphate-alpha-4-amino-4-deoxy-L-arabinose arabinosyl transferase [Aminobacter sp. MSH1]
MLATGIKTTETQHKSLSLFSYLLLAALCLFAFAPGISTLPPTDRDESRFVQATKQMVESGDYVDIRFQDVPRYKKPAGIYWLQSAAVLVSGEGSDAPIWVYRLVSVLAGTFSVLALAFIGDRMFGRTAGVVAGLGLMGILMLGVEARIAKTDATLLATALLAQGALAAVYLGHKAGRPQGKANWLFWIAHGLALLIKGPVIPFLSLLTVATIAILDRDRSWLRKLRPFTGILVTLLVAAPWLILITIKTGTEFWQESVGKDLLSKVGSGQESHGFPPGYYFLTYSVFMWPFALVALEGGLKALKRFRDDPRLLFCLAWYLPYWIAIELIPTKLPHYAMPAYPALLLLMAWSLTDPAAAGIELSRWQLWIRRACAFGVFGISAGLAAIALGITPYFLGQFSWWGQLAGLLVLVAATLGAGMPSDMSPLKRTGIAAAAAAAAFGVLTLKVLPPLKPLWLSPQIAEQFEKLKPCTTSVLASAGYSEPSLVFLAGTSTQLTNGKGAAAALAADPACAIAVVSAAESKAFLAAVPGGAAALRERGRIEGMNYSKGESRTLTFYVVAK